MTDIGPDNAQVTWNILLQQDDWQEHLRDWTLQELKGAPPATPPVWFYDNHGSQLYDQITTLPEYYPTQLERDLLARYATEIAEACQATSLVELGAGSAEKTMLLLQSLTASEQFSLFAPMDCSEGALQSAVSATQTNFPQIPVTCTVGDFHHHMPDLPRTSNQLVAFLGSTIGNMAASERNRFLTSVSDRLRPGDRFLLGTDLIKDEDRLVAAYNDSAGVTAQFNLNALRVLNAELGADFALDQYTHQAVWVADQSRIEMRLITATDQTVTFAAFDGFTVTIPADAWLRTECSYKFTPDTVDAELAAVGLETVTRWCDDNNDYALTLAHKP